MEMKSEQPKRQQERGIYLILVAFFLFVLVALCGLVIGLGFLSTNKSRVQNIANVSSIAALDSFIQARDGSGNPLAYGTRRNLALSRANELIVANKKLPGVRFDLGDVALAPTAGPGGKLTFGMWYPERPATGPTPCGNLASDYPCFIENPPAPTGTPFANAVKLELSSQPTNPLIAPFTKIFGSSGMTLNTYSIARVVQRCVAFLLDVSMSTVQETHISTTFKSATNACVPGTGVGGVPCDPCIALGMGGNCTVNALGTLAPTPALIISTPSPMSLFAFQVGNLGPMAGLTPPPAPQPCQDISNFDSDEFLYFCNMPQSRTPGAMPTPYTQHYRSDYRTHATAWGTVFVDKLEEGINTYVGPQPLSRFFLSFNAGLRAVNQIRSPGDRALLYVFTGQAVGTEPIGTPPYTLTDNLNMLIQLTNINNRGTYNSSGALVHPVIEPNFVSRGYFPILVSSSDPIGSNSNHAQAIWDAIGALSNCPDSARRSIIIATDGIPSCDWNRTGNNPQGTPQPDPAIDCPPPVGGDYYNNYLAAEQKILGPIKDELVKRGISVTAILDSEAIEPNFVNATIPPGPGTPNGEFINPEDASQNGFCAGVPGSGCAQPFFNVAPLIPLATDPIYQAWLTDPTPPPMPQTEDHFAFLAKDGPQYGVKFRRPNALWGQLALDTQGVICPLLPKCQPEASAYSAGDPPILVPTWRQGMSSMTCAPINQDKAQQAINCVLSAIGVNPYQNVEEIPPTIGP